MKHIFALAAFLFAALPAGAETIEELKAQLEAQKQINALQRQRIETLEAELAGRKIAPPARAEVVAPEIAADDPRLDLDAPGDEGLESRVVLGESALLQPLEERHGVVAHDPVDLTGRQTSALETIRFDPCRRVSRARRADDCP